jgi:hypothetical protein
MPQTTKAAHQRLPRRSSEKPGGSGRQGEAARHSVGLPQEIADKVERYAETVDMSASKAIGTLVGLGLENHESRKREFFRRLRKNLADNPAADDARSEDQLVDEFRALILGR